MSAQPIKRDVIIIRPQVVILCRECELEGNVPLIAARVINGELIVDKRPHHGKPHQFKADLEYLKRLLVA